MYGFMIAGTHSGCGKTTVSIALMRAFSLRGMQVQPFKVGPDYIDPMFHRIVTGNYSYNLDSYLLDEKTIRYLFYSHTAQYTLAIIEGVMGLYDGSGPGNNGSSAHVASILDIPVILVVDAHAMARSVCALISGYMGFDPYLKLKGVILNNLSGAGHYQMLKQMIEMELPVSVLGYLPAEKGFALPSRHLGLVPAEELPEINQCLDKLGKIAADTIDLEKLLTLSVVKATPHPGAIDTISGTKGKAHPVETGLPPELPSGKGIRLALALDKAFNFYYQDNIELLQATGVEIIPFSPLKDESLHPEITALYLGGGFPEVFARELSANTALQHDIYNKALRGLPVYAECGGLMYLTREIKTSTGACFPMVGFFHCRAEMTEKLQRFGYVEIGWDNFAVKGHEFHHSRLIDIDEGDFTTIYRVQKNNKQQAWCCGLLKKNVLAAYAHIHFYSSFDFLKALLALFRKKGDL